MIFHQVLSVILFRSKMLLSQFGIPIPQIASCPVDSDIFIMLEVLRNIVNLCLERPRNSQDIVFLL